MNRTRASRPKAGFLKHHSLSFAAIGVLLLWVFLYLYADPKTHRGSFFGNAIADWTGVVVTVIATDKGFFSFAARKFEAGGMPIAAKLMKPLGELNRRGKAGCRFSSSAYLAARFLRGKSSSAVSGGRRAARRAQAPSWIHTPAATSLDTAPGAGAAGAGAGR